MLKFYCEEARDAMRVIDEEETYVGRQKLGTLDDNVEFGLATWCGDLSEVTRRWKGSDHWVLEITINRTEGQRKKVVRRGILHKQSSGFVERTHQSRDPEGYTYQSSDPERYTYQSSDPEEYTYQSSDPEGCTYQSSDPEGYTYQSSDPEGCTYQSSDPEGYTYQ
ncbi:NBS-LRR type resistance protein [Cucumis melo var. makuwa]|uniref:NBS-LRR type resistance protein n=1 Tax=Cucumis melo var. makuwa TaxID=1194695 RepID=A0A5D3DDJ1_CUCMM|nr:NBS-LRR type resistance protein [Cucumis melo var. makuwa]TYK21339.1 NBS-LRR type resistance protein [Cucumis melo var. makuwa]